MIVSLSVSWVMCDNDYSFSHNIELLISTDRRGGRVVRRSCDLTPLAQY